MRAKQVKRKHTANAQIQVFGLSKAGTSIEVDLFAEAERLGTLIIGRGSITWRGAKRKKVKRYSWPLFAELMDSRS